MKAKVTPLSYSDYQALYPTLSVQPGFFCLSSFNTSHTNHGQWSFMGANPFLTIHTQDKTAVLTNAKGKTTSQQNIFEIIQEQLDRFALLETQSMCPFLGGAVGYFSYETSRFLSDFKHNSFQNTPLPDVWLGFYATTYAFHHATEQGYRIELPITQTALNWPVIAKNPHLKPFTAETSKESYVKQINAIKHHIYEGDLYQLNLSHRFSSPTPNQSLLTMFETLQKTTPTPYSAYLNTPFGCICSASPEQFVSLQDGFLQTRPIKGTIRRDQNQKLNKKQQHNLLESAKNKAELLMIVDLERHDLGKICKPGSIQVPELFRIEDHGYVNHLVSTVTGQILPQTSSVEVLKALFPGGSITGAPKIKSVELISKFETSPRSVYTGAVGYLGFNQNLQFNIAIRTLYTDFEKVYLHAGGGIVADSDPEDEWNETLLKIKWTEAL